MTDVIGKSLLTSLEDMETASAASPFDAVVIGAGSAGITAARALAENGRRVALLESGPLSLLTHLQSTALRFDPNLARSVQNGLQYSPTAPDGSPFGALIGCVGGRGLFWNGAAPRFAPADFEGWPITYQSLESHYAWAEREFRVTRDYGDTPLGETICRLLRLAGVSSAQPGPYAVDNHPTRDGWLAGTIGNSLAPLLRTTFLTSGDRLIRLSTGAFVRRIIIERGTAKGVEVVDRQTKQAHNIAGKSVVLAAGAFESCRLAMVSSLPASADVIGHYITDHMFLRAYFPIPPSLYDPSKPEVAIVWVPADPSHAYQLEIHLPSDNLFLWQSSTVWKPDASTYYAAMVRSFAPIQPRHDNFLAPKAGDEPGSFQVTLTPSADDLAVREQMKAAIANVGKILNGTSAPIQIMPPGASHHEAGGLCMGTDKASSVVDEFGRFWSVGGLVVVDAALWPDVSPANPHLTIVAIARRNALQLDSDLRS